jgi:hypothetical protein
MANNATACSALCNIQSRLKAATRMCASQDNVLFLADTVSSDAQLCRTLRQQQTYPVLHRLPLRTSLDRSSPTALLAKTWPTIALVCHTNLTEAAQDQSMLPTYLGSVGIMHPSDSIPAIAPLVRQYSLKAHEEMPGEPLTRALVSAIHEEDTAKTTIIQETTNWKKWIEFGSLE